MNIAISNFVSTKRTVLYFLGGILILGELWFLATLVPRQVEEIRTLQKSQEEISKEVALLDKAVKILLAVDQRKLAKELVSVNAVLPSQKKTSGLVAGIAKIASESSVVLKELEFSPGKFSTDSAQTAEEKIPGSQVRRVGAGLTIAGGLNELTVFLTKIQAASQLIGVDSLNFSSSTSRQQIAQIALQVYYEPVSSQAIDWSLVRPVSADEETVLRSLTASDVFILPGEGR